MNVLRVLYNVELNCSKTMRGFFVLAMSLLNLIVIGQIKDVGLPFINNYSREDYGAGTQNWAITQDDNGIMYFANYDGVLRFNGENWNLFPLPNNSIVHALTYSDGKLYAGGFDEFGYFCSDESGKFTYTSISSLLDSSDKNFSEIWRIYSTRYGIVFQSFHSIYIYSKGELHKINPKSRFGFSYYVDNNLFVIDRKHGIYVLQGKQLKPLFLHDTFFTENEIAFIFSSEGNNYLIGTTNNGVFVYDGKKLIPWEKKVNELFVKNQIFTAIELGKEEFAIGTIQNGVYIINIFGEIVQHLNRYKGLQNNTILSLYYDSYKNLWLGLDSGIDGLEISSPITTLNYCFNIETSYTSIVYDGILYIGTNQGLFAKPINRIRNKNLYNSGFKLIEGTKGQVWKLKVIDGQLLCGYNLGTLVIKGFNAYQISDILGGWDFVQVPGNSDYMIGGTYTGLVLYKRVPGSVSGWKSVSIIEGLEESCRELMFDDSGNLWMLHNLKGVFKLILSDDLLHVKVQTHYSNSGELPISLRSFSTIKNEFVFVTSNGLHSYNVEKDTFLLNEELNSIFGDDKSLTRIQEDYMGDVWFFSEKHLGVFRLQEDGSYTKIKIPFNRIHNQFISHTFENVYTYDKNNVFIGGLNGMLHYNPAKLKSFSMNYKAYLSEIKVIGKQQDSLIYSFNRTGKERLTRKKISFRHNSISFDYFAPFYEAPNEIEFSYRLLGFEDKWSSWSNRSLKEYTNLHEGEFVFEVKAKNIYNKESEIASYPFLIKPPFYRTIAAYLIYISTLILILVFNLVYFKRRIENTRRIEKIKHDKVLVTKETEFKEEVRQSEEQIEKLKNDKLLSSMRHKNMELANSAMHLIQKNKFLTSLKGELTKMWGDAENESVKSNIKLIIKKIDKDLKNAKHMQVFDKNFDLVHQDFLKRLKEKHPALTPNDLRLCAYLKMNISTKEIAPLMNISIRGLEISRYRLRKKLNLEREINLTEYILSI